MNERHDSPIDEAALSRAQALRLAADGELSAPGEANAASDAEARARIAFERSLRGAVGRVMAAEGETPAELRRRIAATLEREAATPGVLGVLRRNWSLAAMILLAISLGVVLAQRAMGPTPEQRRGMEFMAAMLHGEASRFTGAAAAPMPFEGAAGAASGMPEVLGIDLAVRDLSSLGLEVAGLAPCSLPWSGRSGQLLYRAGVGEDWVSLIMNVAPAPEAQGASGLPDEASFRLEPPAGGDSPVFVWREGNVVFYLQAEDPGLARRALRALGAPEDVKPFHRSGVSEAMYPGA